METKYEKMKDIDKPAISKEAKDLYEAIRSKRKVDINLITSISPKEILEPYVNFLQLLV